MAFTQEQVDALEKAIAEGATRVKYADKEVEYRSLSDMIQLLNLMKQELGALPAGGRKFAYFSKGTI